MTTNSGDNPMPGVWPRGLEQVEAEIARLTAERDEARRERDALLKLGASFAILDLKLVYKAIETCSNSDVHDAGHEVAKIRWAIIRYLDGLSRFCPAAVAAIYAEAGLPSKEDR